MKTCLVILSLIFSSVSFSETIEVRGTTYCELKNDPLLRAALIKEVKKRGLTQWVNQAAIDSIIDKPRQIEIEGMGDGGDFWGTTVFSYDLSNYTLPNGVLNSHNILFEVKFSSSYTELGGFVSRCLDTGSVSGVQNTINRVSLLK